MESIRRFVEEPLDVVKVAQVIKETQRAYVVGYGEADIDNGVVEQGGHTWHIDCTRRVGTTF